MKNIKNFAQMRARTLLALFILLFAGIGQIGAVENSPVRQGAQSQPLQQVNTMTIGTYTGTVYEPFSSAVPSEQAALNSNNSSSHHLGSVRTFGKPGETGQSGDSPIGEPWILAIFAAAFAGIIAFRKKQHI